VTITVYECTAHERPACSGAEIASSSVTDTYEYDDAGNRTRVVEDNGAGAVTRYYCYDARNQLTKVATVAGCGSGVLETYAYDDAGSRTANGSRTFTYSAAGQLSSCSSAACGTPTFDADGRLTAITTASGAWTYQYDAEGRLTTACKASSCTGTPARLDMTYDAQGHRIRLVETPAGGSPVITTDFSYEGDRVVREVSTSSAGPIVTRSFTTDEAGAIIKYTEVETGDGTDETYLVTYNGHGDAIALAEIDPGTGVLITANRVTYSTWGTPTVTTHNGYANLGFRYLYVGRFDVQWDDFSSAGLLYMHARHYQPEFGRFLQPDPSAQEANLYAYAENSPITKIDPSGLDWLGNYNSIESAYCRELRNFNACALNLALGWKASQAAVARYGYYSSVSEGKGDACRHCLWQASLTKGLGWQRAQAFGNMHEGYSANSWVYWKTGRTWATRMDLYNNEKGRAIGEIARRKGFTWDWMFRRCQRLILDQVLIYRSSSAGR